MADRNSVHGVEVPWEGCFLDYRWLQRRATMQVEMCYYEKGYETPDAMGMRLGCRALETLPRPLFAEVIREWRAQNQSLQDYYKKPTNKRTGESA